MERREPESISHDQASAIFADYVLRAERGEATDLQALLAAHPGLTHELLHLQKQWEDAQALLGRLAPGASLVTTLGSTGSPRRVAIEIEALVDRLRTRTGLGPRYRALAEIARGGMGTVLLVWDDSLRRNLAMKVLHESPEDAAPGERASRNPRALARFLEEAQVTGQLDHPGIVPVHELGVDERGRAYFTMKHVRGETFQECIAAVHAQKEEWTQNRALSVLLRVCEAMSYAHAKGVLHRDLKPSNIMVGRFGEVYVMDWGLARILQATASQTPAEVLATVERPKTVEISSDRRSQALGELDSPLQTAASDIVGTPSYMSPEQAEGAGTVLGPESDVYSVGAMLYHLLSGKIPYLIPGKNNSAHAVWGRVLGGPPPPLEQIGPQQPQELVAICEKAMARTPAERYSDMTALARDLRAWLEGRVVTAHRTGAWIEFQKWVRRNPVASRLGLLALLALLGLAASTSLLAARWKDARAGEALHRLALREDRLERGYLALGDQEPARALTFFAPVLEQDQGQIEASAGYAMALLQSQGATAALAWLDSRRNSGFPTLELERLELHALRTWVQEIGPEQAQAQMQSQLGAKPMSFRALAGWALARAAQGDVAAAVERIDADWNFVEAHPALMFLRYEFFRRLSGMVAEARAEWQRQRLPVPTDATGYYLSGLHLLSNEENYAEALDQWTNAILSSSESRPLYYFAALRAAALSRESHWSWRKGRKDSDTEMMQKLAKAICTKWPNSPGAAENVLHAYLHCRNMDPRPILGAQFHKLLESLQQTLESDPENLLALHRLARARYMNREFEPAVELLQQLIARKPEDATLRYELALWHTDRGHLAEALDLWRDFVQQHPENGGAWRELAALLYDLEDHAAAKQAFQRAEFAFGPIPDLKYALGNTLSCLGEFEAAAQCFASGRQLVERGDRSGNHIAFGDALRRTQQMQEWCKEEASLLAFEKRAGSNQEADFLGDFLRARGQPVAAAALWNDFLAGDSKDPLSTNYWDAALCAGFAANVSTDEEHEYWREQAATWLLRYFQECRRVHALEDPSLTTEAYARLLRLAQLCGAFQALGREPSARNTAPAACRALWEFVEAEIVRLQG